jgi:uncharacterized coiled-coil protein SlyX
MFQSNILDLFQAIAILALAGALIYFWQTINRLHQTVRRLEERVESLSRTPAPSNLSAVPVPAPVPAPTPAPAPVPAPVASLKVSEVEAIDEGVLTAIAAAVAMIVREPHRIIAIQTDAGAQLAWSSEGRRDIYHSHKIR